MRVRRWAAIWLVAIMATTGLGATARAQYEYGDQLPEGVLAITVDGQPINAGATPRIANRNPVFAGRLEPGPTEVELALGNGELVRFTLEVDPQTGRFQGRAPNPLAPGTYTLYIDDEVVGDFVVGGEDGAAAGGELLDLAALVPFPADFNPAVANLGLIDGSYRSLAEEARQTAEARGGGREAVTQAEQELTASGWQGRYDVQLAVPRTDAPTQFETLVNGFVIQYATAANAEAAFAASATGEEVEAETIGDASRVTRASGVTSDTGAAYQSLQLLFRQDRFLFVVSLADLLNREPDLAALQAAGRAIQERAEARLAGDAQGLSRQVLRLDLAGLPGQPSVDEHYEVFDGALVAAYNEEAAARSAREAAFADTDEVYAAAVEARLGGGDDEAASEVGGGSFLYNVTLYRFADEEAAETWLNGLGERLGQDPEGQRLAAFDALEDPPTFGDATAAFSLSRQSRGQTTSGYRFYVLDGDRVAQIELVSTPDAPLTAVEELVEAQVACLDAEDCPDLAPLPAGLGQEAAG